MSIWVEIAHIVTPLLLFGTLLYSIRSYVQQNYFYRLSLRPILITTPNDVSVSVEKQEIKVKLLFENIGKTPADNIQTYALLTNSEDFPIKKFKEIIKQPPHILLFVPNGKEYISIEHTMPLYDANSDQPLPITFEDTTKIYHHNYLCYNGLYEEPVYYEQYTHLIDIRRKNILQIGHSSNSINKKSKGDKMTYTNLINVILTMAILWLAYEARKSPYRGALYNNQISGYLDLRKVAFEAVFQLSLSTKSNDIETEKIEKLSDELFIKLLKYGDILQKDLFEEFKEIWNICSERISNISKEKRNDFFLKAKERIIKVQDIADKIFSLKGLNKESEKLLKLNLG